MGIGAFPETPLSMQWFGMHGAAYGNWAVDEADLLLVLGARFDDRITGDTGRFAAKATIVHIDIDASEHNKNKRVALALVSDVKYALGRLNELRTARFTPPDTAAWHAQIATWKKDHPFSFEPSKHIQPQEAVKVLFELTKGDAIITTGVGHTRCGRPSSTVLTSQGATSARSDSVPWATAIPRPSAQRWRARTSR